MRVTDLIGTKLGSYRLSGVLGSGGMAVVYRGTDASRQPVAVKALLPAPDRDPDAVTLFRREAEEAARLDHRNLVSVLGSGEDRGVLYCVMELVEGRTLEAYLEAVEMPPDDEVVHILRGICRGLAYLHDQGFVHRDVKPGNVFLRGARPDVLLGDFGLLRNMEAAEEAARGEFHGTPEYMAPEQYQHGTVDQRTDIYQLGVLLYRVLAGTLPFHGPDMIALGTMHMEKRPPRPRHWRPEIPQELEEVILRCLEKDPDRRYPEAKALVADLNRYLVRKEFEGAKEGAAAVPVPRPVAEHTPGLVDRWKASFWKWEASFRKDLWFMLLGIGLGLLSLVPMQLHLPVPIAFQLALVISLLVAYLTVRRRHQVAALASLALGWISLLGIALALSLVFGADTGSIGLPTTTTVQVLVALVVLRGAWLALRDAGLWWGGRVAIALSTLVLFWKVWATPLSYAWQVHLPLLGLVHLALGGWAMAREQPGKGIQSLSEAGLAGSVGLAMARLLP